MINYFNKDYAEFIKNRIFPLIGLGDSNQLIECDESDFKDYVNLKDNKLMFGTNINCLFSTIVAEKNNNYDEDIGLIKNIIKEYISISRNDFSGKTKNNYGSLEQFHYISDYALQKGIANWISGNDATKNNFELLLNELDNWKLKTYEGKNVTFNFRIINSNDVIKLSAKDFIDFIKDDISAVLTDPTASMFILNQNCDLIGYSTIFNSDEEIKGYKIKNNVPFRFAQILSIDSNKYDNYYGINK